MIEIKHRTTGAVLLRLDRANLCGADLRGANLGGAYLCGACLGDADLGQRSATSSARAGQRGG